MPMPHSFAACSPHFSITIPFVHNAKSRNELQQENDIKHTSAASVIQLKSSLHNPVVLFYKAVLKIQLTTPPHDTTVRLIVPTVALYTVDILPDNYRLSLPVGF
jgi:hypothetical protein